MYEVRMRRESQHETQPPHSVSFSFGEETFRKNKAFLSKIAGSTKRINMRVIEILRKKREKEHK